MLERVYSFLVVLLLMFSGEVFGQFGVLENSPVSSISSKYIKKPHIKSSIYLMGPGISVEHKKNEKYVSLKSNFIIITTQNHISLISPSLYKDQLGFVCKKEWELEKITKVPLRFRVGSLDYVNYLEQKPNAIKPTQ